MGDSILDILVVLFRQTRRSVYVAGGNPNVEPGDK